MQCNYPKHIRQLPAAEPRVENGAVAFGNDWPGVFIRGDSALFFAMYLRALMDEGPEPELLYNLIARNAAVALANLLESCDLSRPPPLGLAP